MTGTGAVLATDADRVREIRQAKKEKEIREKYSAELAALRADSFSPAFGTYFFTSFGRSPRIIKVSITSNRFRPKLTYSCCIF